MPDIIQKSFVRSFIDFLKKQLDAQLLPPESLESIEVAIQCLQAAFEVGDADFQSTTSALLNAATDDGAAGAASVSGGSGSAQNASVDTNKIELFDLFESLYIKRDPKTLEMAEAIKNEGNRLMKEGKFNEALLQYNRAVTFDPKNPIYYGNRAAAYIRLHDNERAVTDCKSALLYNPNYSKAYGRLGIAYMNLGKNDEAELAFGKAIELEPDNQEYRNNLEIARNKRNTPTQSNLAEGLNAMLGIPTIRDLFRSAEIDVEQLQTMTQNPIVMNTIGQLLGTLQADGGGIPAGLGGLGAALGGQGGQSTGGGGTGVGGGMGGGVGAMPNDMLQLFQTFASQLAANNQGQGGRNNSGNNGNQQSGQHPPPSN